MRPRRRPARRCWKRSAARAPDLRLADGRLRLAAPRHRHAPRRDAERAGAALGDPQAAQALSQLPGESWLGIGLGHAGSILAGTTAALSALSSLAGKEEGGGLSLGSLIDGLTGPLERPRRPTRAAARRDYRSWMGSAGIFAAGLSVLELKAAVSISSNDARSLAGRRRQAGRGPAQRRRRGRDGAHPRHRSRRRGAPAGRPARLFVAAGPVAAGPKFVLALGEAVGHRGAVALGHARRRPGARRGRRGARRRHPAERDRRLPDAAGAARRRRARRRPVARAACCPTCAPAARSPAAAASSTAESNASAWCCGCASGG